MKKISIILLFSIIIFGCKKNRLSKDKEILVGTWNWSETILLDGGCKSPFIRDTINPNTEGVKYSLIFYKKGIVEYFENNSLISRYDICFEEYYYSNSNLKGGYCFSIFLDCDNNNILTGCVRGDSLISSKVPYKFFKQECIITNNYLIRD